MLTPRIQFDYKKIKDFCKRRHIRKLCLFGSVLRDDFREDSDIDILYEFKPGYTVGFEIFDIDEELSKIFGGRKVDLVSDKYLNRHIRNHPYFNLRVIYVEG